MAHTKTLTHVSRLLCWECAAGQARTAADQQWQVTTLPTYQPQVRAMLLGSDPASQARGMLFKLCIHNYFCLSNI